MPSFPSPRRALPQNHPWRTGDLLPVHLKRTLAMFSGLPLPVLPVPWGLSWGGLLYGAFSDLFLGNGDLSLAEVGPAIQFLPLVHDLSSGRPVQFSGGKKELTGAVPGRPMGRNPLSGSLRNGREQSTGTG